MTGEQEQFERQIKQVIKDQPLDESIQRRLDQARRLALESSDVSSSKPWRVYAVAASVAVVAVLGAVMMNSSSSTQNDFSEDLDLLMVEENFELIEDLDFYRWMSVASDEG